MTLLAGGLAFLMPIFVLGLVRLRVLTSDRLRKNRRIAYVAAARLRDPAADRRPGLARVRDHPAAHPVRDVDLALASSWSAAGTAAGTRTSPKPSFREGHLRRLGGPRRGAADSRRRRRDRRRRAHRRRRDARRSSASDEHYDEAVILPGFVNAHTHLEYDVYAGFGDGLALPGLDRPARRAQAADRPRGHGGDRAARARSTACARASRPSATAASAARPRPHAPISGCAGTIYLEVFGATDAPIRERFEPMRERDRRTRSRTTFGSGSRRMPRTRARIDLYRACAELGLPVATHLAESDAETEFLRTGTRRLGVVRGDARPAAGHDRASARSQRRVSSDSNVIAAHCVKADEEEIALLADARRRRRALPALERDPRLRRRAAHRAARGRDPRRASPPTAPPRRRRSTCSTRCARRSSGARAREGRPDALTAAGRARARHARRRTRARARRATSARSCPESRPI